MGAQSWPAFSAQAPEQKVTAADSHGLWVAIRACAGLALVLWWWCYVRPGATGALAALLAAVSVVAWALRRLGPTRRDERLDVIGLLLIGALLASLTP